MGYFRTVPREVEECALVDGATRIQALWRIILPIAVPGLVCAALFAFTLSWNEFIYALTFTSSSDEITASVGVTSELIRGDIYFWGSLMAGAMLASIPIVVLYVFFLDYYVSGLTAGAIKYVAPSPFQGEGRGEGGRALYRALASASDRRSASASGTVTSTTDATVRSVAVTPTTSLTNP